MVLALLGRPRVAILLAAAFVDDVFEIGIEVKHVPNLVDYFSEELSTASSQ
jgi:hypothetical protein